MKEIILKRIAFHLDGTFGVLILDNAPFAITLEPEWKNNQTDISCIPAGAYICKRVNSPRFGDTFEVTGVPNRTSILLHRVNTEADTLGGGGIAEEFGILNGKTAVLSSGRGFAEFMEKMKGLDTFLLTIKE